MWAGYWASLPVGLLPPNAPVEGPGHGDVLTCTATLFASGSPSPRRHAAGGSKRIPAFHAVPGRQSRWPEGKSDAVVQVPTSAAAYIHAYR